MTPHYAQHASLMLRALRELHRINHIQKPKLYDMELTEFTDDVDNSKDRFVMTLHASAVEGLVDEPSNKLLYKDSSLFTEDWSFTRVNQTWLLDGIRQETENSRSIEKDLVAFAADNDMFYSADYGWLLIPPSGQLVKHGAFGSSDINNHVIGTYHDLLMQLYTFTAYSGDNSSHVFLVGQISLPRSYDGILIRRKGIFGARFLHCPKGYQTYTFEWPDFNKRYHVCASDPDRLAAFELLNPGFMAYLYDNFNNLNIEVIHNIVYFYVKKRGHVHDYSKLLEVLRRAFVELQL